MISNKITINPIVFKQAQIPATSSVSQLQRYTFEQQNKVKSASINKKEILGPWTDERIAQVNKTRMLPEGLIFKPVNAYRFKSGSYLSKTYYVIEADTFHIWGLTKDNPAKRILPEGYIVVKSTKNRPYPHAVEI